MKLTFYKPDSSSDDRIPLFTSKVKAGFPSPADDYIDDKINLHEMFIKNKDATFFVKADGDSMINAGINDGALMIVDRSLEASNNDVAICFLDGEFTVKRIKITRNKCYLVAENPNYKPIEVTKDNEFVIWGIVTYVIQKPR